jgi:hypothetical protein
MGSVSLVSSKDHLSSVKASGTRPQAADLQIHWHEWGPGRVPWSGVNPEACDLIAAL